MQFLYFTTQVTYATGHSLVESTPLQRCSPCILQARPIGPQDTRCGSLTLCRDAVLVFYNPDHLRHRTLVGGSLTPCRDAVLVFYKPSRLGHRIHVGEVYPSVQMQSLYSTTQAIWATGHSLGKFTSLQKCSRCILQPQPTGLKTV